MLKDRERRLRYQRSRSKAHFREDVGVARCGKRITKQTAWGFARSLTEVTCLRCRRNLILDGIKLK